MPLCISAQIPSGTLSIRVEVHLPAGSTANEFYGDISTTTNHAPLGRGEISEGNITFEDLAPGTYVVRVLNRYGNAVFSQVANAGADHSPIVADLVTHDAQYGPGGAVSVQHLAHRPAAKSVSEFNRANAFLAHGETEKALECLKKSVADDPKFVEARVGLGAALLRAGDAPGSAEAFTEALKEDPQCAPAESNLAFVYLLMNRAGDAEQCARRALRIDPVSSKTHFVLGQALLAESKTAEAEEQLRGSAEDVPRAHLLLARLYYKTGRKLQSMAELRKYLPSATTLEADKIKEALADLERETPR